MTAKDKRNTWVLLGIGLLCGLGADILQSYLPARERTPSPQVAMLFVVYLFFYAASGALIVWAFGIVARARGHNPAWGLVGILVLLLPNRTRVARSADQAETGSSAGS